MLPEPLHPPVVHFPIVLGVALPLLAAYALWRIHDGAPVRLWRPIALVAVLTFASAFVATRTGAQEEERVEDVLGSHDPIHEHEEAAELFLWISGVVAGLALVGFAPGVVGRGARLLVLVGAVGGLAAVTRAGLLGGELAYQHGAAAAYTTGTGAAPDAATTSDDDDEDDR